MKWIVLAVWLIVGYFFARWFVNSFLDDRKWADTNKEAGAGTLLILTIVGPAMGFVMLMHLAIYYVMHYTGPTIKRLYGVK